MKYALAFDIGTGSGRGILGTVSEDGRLLETAEVCRFSHAYIRIGNGYYWDYLTIYRGILDCLKQLHARGVALSSIGIDSWAQDIAYISRAGEVLTLPRCYRDPVLALHGNELEEDRGVSAHWLADRNGIFGGHILTLRQLYYDRKYRPDLFCQAGSFVWMANLLIYLLTGKLSCDISMLSLGGLCDAATLAYDPALAAIADAQDKVPPLYRAGEVIGLTNDAVEELTGYSKIPVICTEAHDTSGACSAIPDGGEYLWFSSGSFAMYGAVACKPCLSEKMRYGPVANYPMADGRCCMMAGSGAGMYHMQRCMPFWKKQGITYEMLTDYAVTHRTERSFRFDDICGTDPDMPQQIRSAVIKSGHSAPEGPFEIYEAFCNALVQEVGGRLLTLERTLERRFDRLYIISGGAKADGVNLRLAEMMHCEVFTGLTEASAIGNLLAQLGGGNNAATDDIFSLKKVEYGL